MTDITHALTQMRRPRLLIRAARHGMSDYNRSRDLKRVLKSATLPGPRATVEQLIEEEARIEDIRRSEPAGYSPARHIEVLIALMGEAKLLPPAPRHA